jgi:ATP-grasp domain, R2K clade family 3
MNWYIQNSGITFDGLERNVDPLVEAVDSLRLPKFGIGYDVENGRMTGLEDADLRIPSFFYGSTRIAELAATSGFRPGAFFDAAWFNPQNWIGKRDDLLNHEQRLTTIGDLRRNWPTSPIFVKSVEAKVLTGMILEGPDVGWFTKEYTHLKDDDSIVISPVAEIAQEWRFFVVDGRVVAGSQYKHDGVKRIREPIGEGAWTRAHWMAEEWLPSPNIVMDICRLKSGEFKVVEFNCLNSSGWYNADILKVVLALEALATKTF